MLRRRGVETVILAGADVHGIMRGKRVPIAELDRAAERGIALCDVIWALPVDEVEPVQPPAGHDGWFPRPGYPDMLAMPDLETARIVPWHDRTALLLCDFLDRDGRAIPLAPRAVLRSVVERARALGVEPIVGIELEFYALRETPQSVLAKRPSQLEAVQERPSVYGVVAASRHEDFAGAVRSTLQEYGLAVEACAPEAGPGQFEINVRAAPALRAADEAFLLKSAVKEIAARHGLLATFMAKPRSDWPGSSCHLHLSLRDGTPAAMRHFLGGLLEGMAELTAIFAPTPNSYRRLTPYSWAATTATWSVDNRSAGVRAICGGTATASPGSSIARPAPTPTRTSRRRRRSPRGSTGCGARASRRRLSTATSTRCPTASCQPFRRRWRRPPTCSSAAPWPATGWATTSSTIAWRCAGPSWRRSRPRSPTGRPRATWRRSR